MKANLFNYTVGNESRKRFKLKDSLKVEKYLNVRNPKAPESEIRVYSAEAMKGIPVAHALRASI